MYDKSPSIHKKPKIKSGNKDYAKHSKALTDIFMHGIWKLYSALHDVAKQLPRVSPFSTHPVGLSRCAFFSLHVRQLRCRPYPRKPATGTPDWRGWSPWAWLPFPRSAPWWTVPPWQAPARMKTSSGPHQDRQIPEEESHQKDLCLCRMAESSVNPLCQGRREEGCKTDQSSVELVHMNMFKGRFFYTMMLQALSRKGGESQTLWMQGLISGLRDRCMCRRTLLSETSLRHFPYAFTYTFFFTCVFYSLEVCGQIAQYTRKMVNFVCIVTAPPKNHVLWKYLALSRTGS